jgi:hypothetical protein
MCIDVVRFQFFFNEDVSRSTGRGPSLVDVIVVSSKTCLKSFQIWTRRVRKDEEEGSMDVGKVCVSVFLFVS